MKTVTLSGYYGYGNAGDEAVLAGLVKAFRACRPETELQIRVLSGQPDETVAAHGVSAAHRYRVGALFQSIRQTDLLLSGGGSLLQDVTSAQSVFYYLGVIRIAQIMGKKTMFVAQGIGPLIRPRTRRLVASVANKSNSITVRDSGSEQLLREIGVTQPPIEVTADPALLLQPERPVPVLEGDWIGVALRPWANRGQELAETLAKAIYKAAPKAHILTVPMQPSQDRPLMEQFAENWHLESGGMAARLDPSRPQSLLVPLEPIVENLAACHMVIGMRLHALILAAACAVPAVALSYDPKVTAFMAQSGQLDTTYDLKTATPNLTELIDITWSNRKLRAQTLQEALPTLRAAAQRNADIAVALL